MGNDVDFGEKAKKAFDFASDLVKQQITLASATLALLVAAAGAFKGRLSLVDAVFLGSASTIFFFSIVMGCWTLMGLTYQLTTNEPSITGENLRKKAIWQALMFLAGILATVGFGISASSAQVSGEEIALTQPKDIAGLFPSELRDRPHAQAFATALAQWNSRSLKFPPRKELQGAMEQRVKSAVAKRAKGYETQVWAKHRLMEFEKLPAIVTPEKPIDGAGLRAVLWAYAINLPLIEKQVDPSKLVEKDPIPYFLLFGEAQQMAGRAPTISGSNMVDAAFKWWTNDWPFCSP